MNRRYRKHWRKRCPGAPFSQLHRCSPLSLPSGGLHIAFTALKVLACLSSQACRSDAIDLFTAGGYLEWLAALKLPASNRQRIDTAKACAEMTIDREYAHKIIPKQREKVETWLRDTGQFLCILSRVTLSFLKVVFRVPVQAFCCLVQIPPAPLFPVSVGCFSLD